MGQDTKKRSKEITDKLTSYLDNVAVLPRGRGGKPCMTTIAGAIGERREQLYTEENKKLIGKKIDGLRKEGKPIVEGQDQVRERRTPESDEKLAVRDREIKKLRERVDVLQGQVDFLQKENTQLKKKAEVPGFKEAHLLDTGRWSR